WGGWDTVNKPTVSLICCSHCPRPGGYNKCRRRPIESTIFFMSFSTGTLAVPCLRVYCVQVSCSPTVGVGHMQGKKPYDAPRVHLRALARLQQLHEEISSGRCPSIQDLNQSA